MPSISTSKASHYETLENRRLLSIVGFPGAASDSRLLASIDFTADGQDDLVFVNDSTGAITLQEVTNAANTPPTLTPVGTVGTASSNLVAIGAGHMKPGADTDLTHPDLIFYDTNLNTIGWWTTNANVADGNWGYVGAGTAIGSTVVDTANWTYWGNGDVNGDDFTDLLFRRNSDGKIGIWYLADGDVIGTDYLGDCTDSDWRAVSFADLDGDANNEILWNNSATGQMVAWVLDSTTHQNTSSYLDYGVTGATNLQVFATGGMDGNVIHNDILIENIDTAELDALVLNAIGIAGATKQII